MIETRSPCFRQVQREAGEHVRDRHLKVERTTRTKEMQSLRDKLAQKMKQWSKERRSLAQQIDRYPPEGLLDTWRRVGRGTWCARHSWALGRDHAFLKLTAFCGTPLGAAFWP